MAIQATNENRDFFPHRISLDEALHFLKAPYVWFQAFCTNEYEATENNIRYLYESMSAIYVSNHIFGKYIQPYRKANCTIELTLQEALELRAKVDKGEIPTIWARNSSGIQKTNPDKLEKYGIELVYKDGFALFVKPTDYAQYVKGNQPLPEGYGYASKPFGQGIYHELNYQYIDPENKWKTSPISLNDKDVSSETANIWWRQCFFLEDL